MLDLRLAIRWRTRAKLFSFLDQVSSDAFITRLCTAASVSSLPTLKKTPRTVVTDERQKWLSSRLSFRLCYDGHLRRLYGTFWFPDLMTLLDHAMIQVRVFLLSRIMLLSQDDLHRVRREPRFRPRSSRSPTTFTYASLWRSDFTVQERTDRYAKRGKGPRSEQEGRRRRVGRRTSRSARGDVWSPFPYVSARVFSFL
jgi:hypothetical protein